MNKPQNEVLTGMVSIDGIIEKTVNKTFEAARRLTDKKPAQIDEAINRAVKIGLEAGYQSAKKQSKDAFKATEKRLYALSDLQDKVMSDIEYLKQIELYGLPERSTDLIRFSKSGSQLSYTDIEKAVKMDIRARIARNKFAIDELQGALDLLTSDEYFRTISGKYFERLPDEIIAEELNCDT